MPFNEAAIIATPVGIRYRDANTDVVFSVVNGIGTSSFYAIKACDAGVYAVSEYGLVARWNTQNMNWIVDNRSYESNGVRLIPDEVVGNKGVLVLAFEDRLAFYDARNRQSILTINKVGLNSLIASPVEAMGVHKDTLYVACGNSLYKRWLDWDNLKNDLSLIDPESWVLVSKGQNIETIAWKGDSLKTFSVKGQWSWDEKGRQTSTAPDSSYIMVEGEPLKIPSLYSNGVSLVRKIAVCKEVVYLAGEYFLLGYDKKKKELLYYTEYANFPLDGTYEVRPLPGGGVITASMEGNIGFFKESWAGPIPAYENTIQGADALTNRMKVLSILEPDIVFYHMWGKGFFLYSDYGRKLEKAVTAKSDECFRKYSENFIVTAGTTVAPDSSGFLTTSVSQGGFDLIYVTRDGEFSCATKVGDNMFSGPIVATRIENSSDWMVMVSGRKSASSEAEGALEVFRVADPGRNGGRLEVLERKVVPSNYGIAPLDMAYDAKGNYLWMVTKDQLQYWDIEKDSVSIPYSVKGVVGAEYTSLEFDVNGNLWVGTMGQGVYRLTRKGLSQDSLQGKQFTSRDGLMNDEVLDIAIDPVYGTAWFSHQKGATMYRRNDLRDASTKISGKQEKGVLAYPNPFRIGEHRCVVIDNLGQDVVVSIYNRAGHLVRFFSKNEAKGGSVDWDGYSSQGNVAAPGVYWYVVKRSSGKSEKGKFIVIH